MYQVERGLGFEDAVAALCCHLTEPDLEAATIEIMELDAELARAVAASCNCGGLALPTPEVTWAEEARVRARYEAAVIAFCVRYRGSAFTTS